MGISFSISKNQKSVCLVTTSLLFASLFIGLVIYNAPSTSADTSQFLDVSINPNGSIKMGVNQAKQFSVSVHNQSFAPFSYNWTYIINSDKTVNAFVNGVNFSLANSGCLATTKDLTFSFTEATEVSITLNVMVKSIEHGSYGYASVTICDPFTTPDLYIDSTTSSADYIIKADGLGWFVAVDGKTGALKWPSTSIVTTLQNVIESLDYGTIEISSGNYEDVSNAGLVAKSNVNLKGNGATINILSDQIFVGAKFENVTNSVWSDLTLIRSGKNDASMTLTESMSCLYATGTTGRSTVFRNVNFINAVDNTGGSNNHGGRFDYWAAPTFYGGSIVGGVGGLSGFGIYVWDYASPAFNNVDIIGASGGDSSCYGAQIEGPCTPTFNGGSLTGGTGSSSYGVRVIDCATPIFTNVIINGGTGPYSYGAQIIGVSKPIFSGCVITGGSGGSRCYSARISQSSAPTFNGVTFQSNIVSDRWFYTAQNNGGFIPFTDKPYAILTLTAVVENANPDATLNLGTTIGGNDIAANVPIGTSGYKHFNFTQKEIPENGYIYASTTAAGSPRIWIYYTVVVNYENCYGIEISTAGQAVIDSSTIIVNKESDAVFITEDALTSANWKITNSHMETLDTANNFAVSASSPIAGVPIYNCQLTGGTSNIKGFANENVITHIQNFSSTSFRFAHGLAGNPTSVQCSFNFTGWTSWTWTADETNVTVTIAGNLPQSMQILAAEVKYIP